MFVANIARRVQICIALVPTSTAKKETLRSTIMASLVLTSIAGLAGVPRVHFDHSNPTSCRFIGQEAVKLGKGPRMHPTLPFPFSVSHALANIGQVLKHNRTPRWGVLHNAFGEDMIVITSLPKPFARKFLQVPFGRFGTTFLEFATEAKDAAFLLFPTPLAKELRFRCHRWVIQAQIHTNHIRGGINYGIRERDNDMEMVAPVMET
jgi:hypothetical protein